MFVIKANILLTNYTFFDLQIETLGDVHCYLWHEVRGNNMFC